MTRSLYALFILVPLILAGCQTSPESEEPSHSDVTPAPEVSEDSPKAITCTVPTDDGTTNHSAWQTDNATYDEDALYTEIYNAATFIPQTVDGISAQAWTEIDVRDGVHYYGFTDYTAENRYMRQRLDGLQAGDVITQVEVQSGIITTGEFEVWLLREQPEGESQVAWFKRTTAGTFYDIPLLHSTGPDGSANPASITVGEGESYEVLMRINNHCGTTTVRTAYIVMDYLRY